MSCTDGHVVLAGIIYNSEVNFESKYVSRIYTRKVSAPRQAPGQEQIGAHCLTHDASAVSVPSSPEFGVNHAQGDPPNMGNGQGLVR